MVQYAFMNFIKTLFKNVVLTSQHKNKDQSYCAIQSVRSIGLCSSFINIIIIIMDITHRQIFHLSHNVLETEFCRRLQAIYTQLDSIDWASLCLRRHKLAPSIWPSWVYIAWRRGHNPVSETFWFKWRTGRYIRPRILIVTRFKET
jgi:hypothetical protein